MKPRILVTGATGRLGANCMIEFMRGSISAAGMCRRMPCGEPHGQYFCGEFSDEAFLENALKAFPATHILHCAALTDVDFCEKNPEEARRVNVKVTQAVLKVAANEGARVIYISTDSVFSGKKGGYCESDPVNPINVYARTKAEAEEEVLRADNCNLVIRTNFYGWSPAELPSLAEWFVSRMRSGKSVPALTDVYWSPLAANQIADLVVRLAFLQQAGIIHLGSSDRCSKHEFALRCAAVFNLDPSLINAVEITALAMKAPRPRNTSLCSQKAEKVLKRAMPSVIEGVELFKKLEEDGFSVAIKNHAPRTRKEN